MPQRKPPAERGESTNQPPEEKDHKPLTELEKLGEKLAAEREQRMADFRRDLQGISGRLPTTTTEKAAPPPPPESRVDGAALDPMLEFKRTTAEYKHEKLLRELIDKCPISTHLTPEDMPVPPEGSAPINPAQAETFLGEYIVNRLNWEEQPRGILINGMPVQAAARLLAMPDETAAELYKQYVQAAADMGGNAYFTQEEVKQWVDRRIMDTQYGIAASVSMRDSRDPSLVAPEGESARSLQDILALTRDREKRKAFILEAMRWYKANLKDRDKAQGASMI